MSKLKAWIPAMATAWFVLLFSQNLWAEVLSIPHQACLPKQHWGGSVITNYHSNGASVQPYPGSGTQVLLCPVMLPNGSIIRNVTLECHDGSGGPSGGFVRASLSACQYNNTYGSYADFDTGDETAPGDARITVSDIGLAVDNSVFHYSLGVEMNNPTGDAGAISFSKFVVEYDPPASGKKVVVIPLSD